VIVLALARRPRQFARTFGQLHYLASLGLLVPGREARIFLPDRIFTHFEREENIETLRGKFDDELVRVHEILEQATSDSVIVMNESFNSTSLSDALFVGTEVMRQVLELACLGVYVTFVDEIASLSESTVSMVSQVVPDNPAERTFKVIRKRADGRAYAWAIAEKYGLSYQRLMERIGASCRQRGRAGSRSHQELLQHAPARAGLLPRLPELARAARAERRARLLP
jgi:DNA mismatch repair protein MutS